MSLLHGEKACTPEHPGVRLHGTCLLREVQVKAEVTMIAAIPEGRTEQNDANCRDDCNNDDGPAVHGGYTLRGKWYELRAED